MVKLQYSKLFEHHGSVAAVYDNVEGHLVVGGVAESTG